MSHRIFSCCAALLASLLFARSARHLRKELAVLQNP